MQSSPIRSHRSRAQWQSLIEQAEHSELSVAAFCRRESISTASFYIWRKRLRRVGERPSVPAPASADFIDLGTLVDTKDNAIAWLIELDLGAGMVLRLRRG